MVTTNIITEAIIATKLTCSILFSFLGASSGYILLFYSSNVLTNSKFGAVK